MSRLKSYLVGSALVAAILAAPVVAARYDSVPAAAQFSGTPCMSCWGTAAQAAPAASSAQ